MEGGAAMSNSPLSRFPPPEDDPSSTVTTDDTDGSDAPPQIKICTLSTVVIVMLGIIGMVEYSMVMPSMAKYVDELGGTNLFYGVCVGLFSFARVCQCARCRTRATHTRAGLSHPT